MLRTTLAIIGFALMGVSYAGCAPSAYERAVAACQGRDVAANERALRAENYLPPNTHVRCGR